MEHRSVDLPAPAAGQQRQRLFARLVRRFPGSRLRGRCDRRQRHALGHDRFRPGRRRADDLGVRPEADARRRARRPARISHLRVGASARAARRAAVPRGRQQRRRRLRAHRRGRDRSACGVPRPDRGRRAGRRAASRRHAAVRGCSSRRELAAAAVAMSRRRLRAFLAAGIVAGITGLPAVSAAALSAVPMQVSDGGVSATVTATTAELSDGRIARHWSLNSDGSVETTSLSGAGHTQWAAAGPDFQLDLDGVVTSSLSGWSLISVTPQQPAAQPGRPASGRGAALRFRYALISPAVNAAGVELDRLIALHPGSAVIETSSTLVNRGPAPVRISAYSLDQIAAADPSLPAEVQAYNGGSDWRDDYRHVAHPSGAFDVEGEVVRFGEDAGFFLVSPRRGGAMRRGGRGGDGRAWDGGGWPRGPARLGPPPGSPPAYKPP